MATLRHEPDQRESILGAGSAIMLRTAGFLLMFAGSDTIW